MSLTGRNQGITNNVWTYYGNISYSLSETINLIADNDGEIIEEVSNVQNDELTRVETPNEYAVILFEKVEWDSDLEDEKIKRELKLYIYCPEYYDEPESDPYEEKYNQLKNEVNYG